mgnify:CR=1 FL=1
MLYCAIKIKLPVGEFKTLVFCDTLAEADKLVKYYKDTYKTDVVFRNSPLVLEDVDHE